MHVPTALCSHNQHKVFMSGIPSHLPADGCQDILVLRNKSFYDRELPSCTTPPPLKVTDRHNIPSGSTTAYLGLHGGASPLSSTQTVNGPSLCTAQQPRRIISRISSDFFREGQRRWWKSGGTSRSVCNSAVVISAPLSQQPVSSHQGIQTSI